VRLKLHWTPQVLAYADDVDLMEDNADTTDKNTETLIDARKKIGPEVNREKTKYVYMSCYQNAGQNLEIIKKKDNVKMFHNLCIWEQQHIQI
jgi:ABC-type siderophore export system fused ATPase/permease subunit